MSREQMDALERMVVELCSHSIRPPLFDVTITRHELDDKALLAVSVAKGTAQHDSPGGSFRRVGSSKTALLHESYSGYGFGVLFLFSCFFRSAPIGFAQMDHSMRMAQPIRLSTC